MLRLLIRVVLLACVRGAELLVGSDTAAGLSLARWDFATNATSPLGSPLAGLQSSPNLAATLLLSNNTWALAPYETATTDRLIQFSVQSGKLSGVSVALGPEERCFLLYVINNGADGEIRCLSEVVSGVHTNTALRTIDRTSGAKRLLASVLPDFSPSGPAAHDAASGVVRALYFYSPTTKEIPQGTYLVALSDVTAATVSTSLVAADLRVLQIAQGNGRTFAIAMVGTGSVFAGTLDGATATFTPLPESPDFSKSFTTIQSTTSLTVGGGTLWFSLWKESATAAAADGPPTYTPWLLGVDNTTGASVYEAGGGSGTNLDFSYLQWSSE